MVEHCTTNLFIKFLPDEKQAIEKLSIGESNG